jgi:hypothetical protein
MVGVVRVDDAAAHHLTDAGLGAAGEFDTATGVP